MYGRHLKQPGKAGTVRPSEMAVAAASQAHFSCLHQPARLFCFCSQQPGNLVHVAVVLLNVNNRLALP